MYEPEGLVICLSHTHPNDATPGVRWLKPSKDGCWGIWKREDGTTYHRPNPARVYEQKPTLSDDWLDYNHRRLIGQLNLHARHQLQLKARGFSDRQIEQLKAEGFRTFVAKKRVKGIDLRVPGVDAKGVIRVSTSVAIPAYTPDLKLIGFQTAPDRKDTGKYKYITGGTQVRENQGPLLFNVYGVPDYTDTTRPIHEAVLYFDGAIRYNRDADGNKLPTGGCGAGAVLTDPVGNTIAQASKQFQNITSNQAEYHGLLLGLQLALEAGVQHLIIQGDSQLVIRQLTGEYEVKHPELKVLNHLCRQFLDQQGSYSLEWVPRDHNNLAHDLAQAGKAGADTRRYFDTRTVWLVDGAFKAYITAFRHHKTVIGCPGGMFSGNEADLARYLKLLGAEQVVLMPDAGDVPNPNTAITNQNTIKALQALGYEPKIGWWNQYNKPGADDDRPGDIDEISPDTPITYLNPEQFLELHPTDVKKRLDQNLIYKPGIQEFDKPVPYPRAIKYRQPKHYKAGDRVSVWQGLIEQGNRVIQDGSGCATFKSSTVGRSHPDQFGVHQLIWIVNDPLSLEYPDWAQYRGRDGGRQIRHDGRVVKAKPGTDPTKLYKQANCTEHQRSEKLASVGIVPSVDMVCLGCTHFENKTCAIAEGWYLKDRSVVLASRRMRIPAATFGAEMLRAADGTPWEDADPNTRKPGAIAFVDDVDPFIQQKVIDQTGLKRLAGELLPILEKRSPALLRNLARLIEMAGEKQGSRWINRSNKAILEALEPFIIEPDKQLQTALNRAYTDDERAEVLAEATNKLIIEILGIEESLALSSLNSGSAGVVVWIADLLDALAGAKVYLYTYRGSLYINKVNQRFIDAATHPAVKATIFLDATAKVEHLQAWLKDYTTKPIPFIAQEPTAEGGETPLIQLTGLGDLGGNRSKAVKEKLTTLKAVLREEHPNYAEVEHLKAIAEDDQLVDRLVLQHRSTSRGSNAAKNHPGLIVYGVSRMNLAAAKARYCLMSGLDDVPDTDNLTPYPMQWANKPGHWARVVRETNHNGFSEYYHQDVIAEINQAYARLRSRLRPGEVLPIIHVTDYPLDTPATVVHVDDLISDEDRPPPLTIDTVKDALNQLLTAKKPLTQAETAAQLGINKDRLVSFIRRSEYDWETIKTLIFYPPETPNLAAETIEKPGLSGSCHSYIRSNRDQSDNIPTIPNYQGFQPSNQAVLTHPEVQPTASALGTMPIDTDPDNPRFKVGDRVYTRSAKYRAEGTVQSRTFNGVSWGYQVLFTEYVNSNGVKAPSIPFYVPSEDLYVL